jgi:hypothetical protein
MRARQTLLPATCLALLALGLAACDGSSEGMLCGAGTVEQGGQCLPEITGCGDGTVLQGGVCVPACPAGQYWAPAGCVAVPACEAGTVFDANAAACVPACGPEEQWDGKACAPLCAPGTQLDPQSGECLPGPEVCAAGTHWEAGQCVADLGCGPGTHAEGGVCLPDRLPEPDVWEAADPDQAAAVELPAAGQAVRLGGTVDTPVDGNADGYVEADWDAFAFDAPAGAWLRLSSISEGAAVPAFFVQSEALDDEGYALYARYALNPVGLETSREVYLPRAGRYLLRVSDTHNMLVDVFGYGFLPVGGQEFSYQVLLENLGAPQPTPAALPLADAGQLEDGALRFYALSGLATRDVLSVRSLAEGVTDQADDLMQAFLLFDPQGDLLREEIGGWSEDAAVSLVVAAAGDHLLVQDFLVAIGPDLAFAISAVEEPVEDCTQAACTAAPLGAGEHRLWSFDLAAGDFFLFSASLPSGTENLRVNLLDEQFQVLSEASAGLTWERWDHLLAAEDTWVYLWIEGWTGAAVPDWTLGTVLFPVPALPAGGALTGVAVEPMPGAAFSDSGLVRFEAQAGQVAVVSAFAPQDPGGTWTQPALDLVDAELAFLGPALDTADPALARLAPALAWIPADGTYLQRAFDLDPAADLAGASYDLGLALASPTALGEPTAGAPVGQTGLALAADARVALFSVDVAQGGSYQVALDPQAGSDLQPEVWVLAFGYHYQATWYSSAAQRELGRIGLVSAGAPAEAVSLPVSAPYAGRLVVVVRDARGLDPAPAGLFDLQISRD